MAYGNEQLMTAVESRLGTVGLLDYRDISVDYLALQVNVKAYTLSKEFKRKRGILLKDHIFKMKMDKALELIIRDHSLSISEVSEIVGYENPEYFSSLFKRQFGTNPSKLRKRGRKAAIEH